MMTTPTTYLLLQRQARQLLLDLLLLVVVHCRKLQRSQVAAIVRPTHGHAGCHGSGQVGNCCCCRCCSQGARVA
jgi:hypothetical protein